MVQDSFSFRANGKLLLSGEYFVLDGALAWAAPCRLGQSIEIIEKQGQNRLEWLSKDVDGNNWFEVSFRFPDLEIINSSDNSIAERLSQILKAVNLQKATNFWTKSRVGTKKVITRLEFPRQWGLGTSSTLIVTIAEWAEVDPYILLADSFGGSGYDIACGMAKDPILFQKHQHLPSAWYKGSSPKADGQFVHIPFDIDFKEQIYFVYLDKKQDSRLGIRRYREQVKIKSQLIEEATQLTLGLIKASSLSDFNYMIEAHEEFISQHLKLKKAKQLYFSDYWGAIKSLGAWGGDFIMATSDRNPTETIEYFNQKGFKTILGYKELILESKS